MFFKLKIIQLIILLVFLLQCTPEEEIKIEDIQNTVLDLWIEKNGESGSEFDYGTLSGRCLLIKKKGNFYLIWSASGDWTYLFQFKKINCTFDSCTFTEGQNEKQPQSLLLKFISRDRFRVIFPEEHHINKKAYYLRAPNEDIENLFGCGHNIDKQFPSKK